MGKTNSKLSARFLKLIGSLIFSSCGFVHDLTSQKESEPGKIEFPNGAYSCRSDFESLFIEKTSDNYLMQYFGILSQNLYHVSDSAGEKRAASKFSVRGDSLYFRSSYLKFEGKFLSAVDFNGNEIKINSSDSGFAKSFEAKTDSQGNYRLRDFDCHGIMGLAGCDGYWIQCQRRN